MESILILSSLLQELFEEHPGRHWLNSFLWEPGLNSQGGKSFVDTFRLLYPTQGDAYTCWCNVTGARITNYGTRIDYILADHALALSELKDSQLMTEVLGSDHCPVKALLKATFRGAPHCPPLCTRFLPEFAGTQQKLNRFLVKMERTNLPDKGRKRGGAEPSTLGDSKKRGTGPPQKGQVDLRSFFKASNKARVTGNARGQLVMGVAERTAEDSGKEPLGATAETATQGCVVEECAAITEGIVENLRKESAVDVAGQEGKNCWNDSCLSRPVQSAALWKSLLSGPAPPPFCKAHGEPCVLRTVKKQGPNSGRRFYVCARPLGKPCDPRARCDFFQWASKGNS